MSLADQIRDYVDRHYVQPARVASRREITIRAGDVHSAMGLVSRMPAVCGALDSKILLDRSGLRVLARNGPHQGANVVFRFAVEGGSEGRPRTEGLAPAPTHAPAARTINTPATSPAMPVPPGKVTPGTVYLVSCVAAKGPERTEARCLYISDWFRKARAHVEQAGADWFILSAEHGLVHPTTIIAPYERTLNTMGVEERRAWARRVVGQMKTCIPRAQRIVVFAGARYREFLMDHLRSICSDVQVPMEGLRIGEQLGWLSRGADGTA